MEAEKKEECQVIETSMLLKNKDTNKIKRRFATVEMNVKAFEENTETEE